jgi:hypothetical protein
MDITHQSQEGDHIAKGEYWCHECRHRTQARINPMNNDVTCVRCGSSFVELLEGNNQLPTEQNNDENVDIDYELDGVMNELDNDRARQQTTSHDQREREQQQLPSPFDDLSPIIHQLFGNIQRMSHLQQEQQQEQQQRMNSNQRSPHFGDLFNMFFNFGNPQAGNMFTLNLNDIFDQINQGMQGFQMGDYFIGDNLQQLINQLFEQSGHRGTPPASKRALDSLPITKASSAEGHNEKECTICQEQYKDGEEIVTLPCSHLFHKECIWPWLLRHATCPTCRYQLETIDESPNPNAIVDDQPSGNATNPNNSNNSNNNQANIIQHFNFSFRFPNGNNNQNNNQRRNDGGSGSNYFI